MSVVRTMIKTLFIIERFILFSSLLATGFERGIKKEPLFKQRLRIVRESDLEGGAAQTLHRAFFAGLTRQEERA